MICDDCGKRILPKMFDKDGNELLEGSAWTATSHPLNVSVFDCNHFIIFLALLSLLVFSCGVAVGWYLL